MIFKKSNICYKNLTVLTEFTLHILIYKIAFRPCVHASVLASAHLPNDWKGQESPVRKESDVKSCRKEGFQDLTCPVRIKECKSLLKIKEVEEHFENNEKWQVERCLGRGKLSSGS